MSIRLLSIFAYDACLRSLLFSLGVQRTLYCSIIERQHSIMSPLRIYNRPLQCIEVSASSPHCCLNIFFPIFILWAIFLRLPWQVKVLQTAFAVSLVHFSSIVRTTLMFYFHKTDSISVHIKNSLYKNQVVCACLVVTNF